MGVLDVIRGAATVAGQGYGGYALDQKNSVAQALAQSKAAQEAERNKVLNALTQRQIAKPQLGDPNFAQVSGEVAGAEAGARTRAETPALVDRMKLTMPLDVQKAGQIAAVQAPIAEATHAANRKTDIANPLPVAPNFSAQTVGGTDGQPAKVVTYDTHSGKAGPVIGDAKPSASTAKLTEPQEKSYLFYNLMKHSEPEITATLASRNVRPAAITAYLNSGPVDALAYAALNNDEQKLIRGMRDFSAGVLRKESGAAITHDELKDTFARFFPAFGEQAGPGSVSEAKAAARQNYLHTMEQEAGPAIDYYGRRSSGQPGGGSAPSHVTGGSREQQLWDAAVAKHGEAKVLQEFGPRPPR